MKWRSFLLAGLFITALSSCNKELSNPLNTVAATTMRNVNYGSDVLQTFDAYLPAARTTADTKVIILLHGGGWTSGDKADLTDYADTLKRRLPQYAIFNVNYRLAAFPYNVFPTQEMDVKAAIDFIFSKSAAYLISGKYVLAGVSAGAHLAMLQGFKYSTPVKPKAIISFSGPSNLIEMYNNPVGGVSLISNAVASAVGATPAHDSLIYATSSPINFITANAPPTILFQGGTDPLVSAAQALQVQLKLTTSGVVNQYIFYPNEAHIGTWSNATMFDAFNKLQAFLQANVQ